MGLLHLAQSKNYLNHIPDAKERSIAQYFIKQYEERVVPLLPKLRRSIVHNDGNECNVLLDEEKVSGLTDFGDMDHKRSNPIILYTGTVAAVAFRTCKNLVPAI